MVESPMYERLMKLVDAIEKASALDALDDQHNAVVCGLNEANNSTYHMRTNQGFTGETGEQVDAWTDNAMKQVQAIKDGHNTAMEYYVEARRAMKHVREEAMQLSPTLIDSKLQALADAAHVVIPVTKYMGLAGLPINAVAATGEAYVQGLVTQANNQREASATDILQRANDTMQSLADGTNAQRVAMEQRVGNDGIYVVENPGPSNATVRRDIERGYLNTSAHEGGVYPGNRDTDYGRSDLRGSGSGLYPAGYDEGGPVNDRVMSSPRIPNRFVTEGEEGSRLNPISDPQDLMGVDLLHTRVNGDWHRNGVIGGYTPAPPVDRYHPLWNVNGGPGNESALAARLSGAGVLGAGALGMRGAARMAGGLGSSAGALGRGAAGALGRGGMAGNVSGMSALRAGSYSGPGYGTYKAPSGTGGLSGIVGADGSRGAGAGTGAAGSGKAGTQGTSGFMGGGAGAGAGQGKGDEKAKRRKYTPFRVEDEDELPEGYVNPMSQTYGTEKDITPAPIRDDGWDPRQW